jgi:hypothetical protein
MTFLPLGTAEAEPFMNLVKFLPCLRACVAMFAFCAITATAQTVAELATQPDASQRDAIGSIAATAFGNLMSKTDPSGNPKTSEQFEESRAMGNLVQALFVIDPESPNDEPKGTTTVLFRIKKDSVSHPDATLAQEMTKVVDSCFAKYYTKFLSAEQKNTYVQKSDSDQVKLFRIHLELEVQKELNKQIIKGYEDEEAKLDKQMSDEYDNAVILSDGRHVLHADNGDFMVIQRNPSQGKDYKLEGLYVRAAQTLYNCEQARGLTGIQGRQACTEEASAPRQASPPSQAPVYHPAPAPAPAPPPASPAPVDDPIGSGGFISAPSTFNVMVCIERPLIDRQAWDNPRPRTKMQAFKTMVLTYIVSVAKPDWEYWISESQFANYLIGKTPGAGQVVSAKSPSSGLVDPIHPGCPSAYSGYWVQAGH